MATAPGLDYIIPAQCRSTALGQQWRVQPKDELIGRLREEFGKNSRYLAL